MTDLGTTGTGAGPRMPSGGRLELGARRARHYHVDALPQQGPAADTALLTALQQLDVLYRALCAGMFNYVPNSGHPGGSISSSGIVQSLLYGTLDYDFSDPDAETADQVCYAAGHKALGLYAAWALRNECVRIAAPELLPDRTRQLRLEDLLGFRRNPTTATPLFREHQARALDGHPTPATPFVKLATGASGVGMTTAVGLAFGALDHFGADAPRVHVIEGEGGMTPGRVYEILACAGSTQLRNIVLHVDWNQASIDSDQVCREGETPGDYVQWSPAELAYLNDWNVIEVPEGFDFRQVLTAQHFALNAMPNDQPTAVVYRTVKGWRYGLEGSVTHGAGHAFCSPAFYEALAECERTFGIEFPRFQGDATPEAVEASYYDFLLYIRKALEGRREIAETLGARIRQARERLATLDRKPRAGAPRLAALYEDATLTPERHPEPLALEPGASVTTRGVLAQTLNFLNRHTGGAFIGSAADLFGSTNLTNLAKGLSEGYYTYGANPEARLVRVGGICEDAIGGFMAGLSTFGHHVGVGSSYSAFIAALQHVTARLHAIGQEARHSATGAPANPFIMVCAHAGPKTGEDGPTHADPQALQLLQENFPRGGMITLTPWDTLEMWPLVLTALRARPAVIAPFVTRPSEKVVDRGALGLPPASAAVKGVYALRRGEAGAGTIVLQGNGVASIFVAAVLPQLDRQGLAPSVFYVASAELFDLLPPEEQAAIFPPALAAEAMGITEFTLPTLYRWVTSPEGRRRSLHPFAAGHYLGSGKAEMVIAEGKLDAASQLAAVTDYLRAVRG